MKIFLKFEGGKDDDPVDPGGRTNQGVIQREYSAWRKRKGLPNRDVFLMDNDERDAIYWENYGAKVRFDELPPGIDVVIADGAINSGPSQSVKWVQRALGISPDGVLGNVTMTRIMDHPDHDKLISDILERRMAFLRALKTFWHFGKGWTSRVNQLKKIGQAWAMGSVGPAIVWENNMNKKAKIVDAKPLLSTAPADATASGGAVSTGIGTAQTTLSPLAGNNTIIDQVIAALIAIGVIATAFGIVYGLYVRRKNNALTDALDLAVVHPANDNEIVPVEVLQQYDDPRATGSATGNMAIGHVSTSGRTYGDTEDRVNPPSAIPSDKQNAT